MPLDVPDGTRCFVDTNILYYALVPTPGFSEHCLTLLDRAIRGDIFIAVSLPVLSDTLHKVMTSEAAEMAGKDRAGMVGYLGKHPDLIQQLTQYPQAIDRLITVPMSVLPVDIELLKTAGKLAVQLGLLTNDAMIVALMQRHQLTNLITNDNDFDRVPDLTVWKPRAG